MESMWNFGKPAPADLASRLATSKRVSNESMRSPGLDVKSNSWEPNCSALSSSKASNLLART
eukprot:11161445-Lingulodinium_polyedra.AAC.1